MQTGIDLVGEPFRPGLQRRSITQPRGTAPRGATGRPIDTWFSRHCRTLGLGPEIWRVLAKCHDIRTRAEYEGDLEINVRIVVDLTSACQAVAAALEALPPPA
jgi:hypothetical protein